MTAVTPHTIYDHNNNCQQQQQNQEDMLPSKPTRRETIYDTPSSTATELSPRPPTRRETLFVPAPLTPILSTEEVLNMLVNEEKYGGGHGSSMDGSSSDSVPVLPCRRISIEDEDEDDEEEEDDDDDDETDSSHNPGDRSPILPSRRIVITRSSECASSSVALAVPTRTWDSQKTSSGGINHSSKPSKMYTASSTNICHSPRRCQSDPTSLSPKPDRSRTGPVKATSLCNVRAYNVQRRSDRMIRHRHSPPRMPKSSATATPESSSSSSGNSPTRSPTRGGGSSSSGSSSGSGRRSPKPRSPNHSSSSSSISSGSLSPHRCGSGGSSSELFTIDETDLHQSESALWSSFCKFDFKDDEDDDDDDDEYKSNSSSFRRSKQKLQQHYRRKKTNEGIRRKSSIHSNRVTVIGAPPLAC